MDYNGTLDWLYNLKRFGIKLDLDNISRVMESLGNPQDSLRIIHVAGTNGKGSVCAMIESILRHAGCKVGLFTSPHLVNFEERIQVGGKKIGKADMLRLVEKIKSTGVQLTFFEFTTAMALLYFYEQDVDYVVLEVGMGGRLDATNIVKPVATAITSISFDHTSRLGITLESIAAEKAGIVKVDVPMFTPVENISIREACEAKKAPLFVVKGEEDVGMNGKFQRKNGAIASAVALYLGISDDKIKEGLMKARWPARLEFFGNVLLDCAHNPDAIEKISEFVRSLEYNKLYIIFGVMKDKEYEKMLGLLPGYDEIILAKINYERAADPGELRVLCGKSLVVEDVGRAYEYVKSIAKEDDLILICGSCYLAGEFLALINNIPRHPIMFVQ